MIHPLTTLRQVGPKIGLGVFATEPIARGTITWALDPLDRVLTPEGIAGLALPCPIDLDRYTWQDRAGNLILCWDYARFVNHSCDPNCLTTDWGFEVAVRNIAPGDEITNDYANLGMRPHEQFRCLCGLVKCRGLVRAGASSGLTLAWAERIATALPEIPRVAQPLWLLLSDDARQGVLAASSAGGVRGARRTSEVH
jgi:uncharacterized protein